MKRSLVSLVVIAAVSSSAFLLANAFFSDTETSSGNLFQAGAIDLKVGNESYYNGIFNQATSWDPSDLDGEAFRFFNFLDLKPGDWGEDTISLRVDTNDAWGCYEVTLTSNDDNTCTEPELLDDQLCDPNNPWTGDLADQVNFAFWLDDGDNVYEDGEEIITQGTIAQALQGLQGPLADSTGGILGLSGQPMVGEQTYYIGKAWCFGEFTFNPVPNDANTGPDVRNSGILCNGENVNNAAQTDSLTADVTFSVIQSRNNPGYLCNVEITPTPEPLLWIIGDIEADQLDDPVDELNFVAFGNFPTPPAIGAPYTRTITSPVDDVADKEFPWNSNFNADYGREVNVNFSWAGPTIPVRLFLGWSPGISQNEKKDIYLNDEYLGTTGNILGVSTPGWWNNMPRYVHTIDFDLEAGDHTLKFLHLYGDGTLWDFIKLERL